MTGDDRIPVDRLKGVGPRLAERLANLGVTSVQDLLFHLPSRYQDRTRLTPIGRPDPWGVRPWWRGRDRRGAGLRAAPLAEGLAGRRGGARADAALLPLLPAQREGLRPGVRLRCYGEVRQGPQSLEIIHPEYQIRGGED